MRTIKIFVASSKELNDEREKLAALANSLNTALMKLDINVIMVEWENLDSSKGKEAKQEEYNKELCTCDMCIVLYATKFGEFTKIEFDTACRELETERSLKKLYVYFKDVPEVTPDLQEFKDGYRERYGHYYSTFGNSDMLIADFLRQFIIYESEYLRDYKYVDIRESAIFLNGAKLVELNKLPFVGNNQRENDLRERITELQQDLEDYTPDHPRYKEKKEKLDKLKKELSEHEEGLWETALFIAKISNTASADLLHRSIELFNSGDNKGALALLKDEDIDKGINHSLHLIEIGNEGKAGLQAELDKYYFKIRVLVNEKDPDWFNKSIKLCDKILDATSRAYGENSLETALAHDYLGQNWAATNGYKAQLEFRQSLCILESLNMRTSYYYADVLGHVGKTYLKYEHYSFAERKFKQTLEIIRQVGVSDYHYYVNALVNIAGLYSDILGRFDEAIDFFHQAEEVIMENEGNQSLLYAEMMAKRAWVYLTKMKNSESLKPIRLIEGTDYYEAITLLNRTLNIASDYLEKNPNQYVTTLYDIGLAHYRANHFDEAEKLLNKALDISKQNHLNYDYINLTLQYVYNSLGHFDKSKKITYDYKNIGNQRPSFSDSIKSDNARADILARNIAHLYLDKFPRPNSYGVDVVSSEDDSFGTFYHKLSEKEIEILREFVNRDEDDWDIDLHEWLESDGRNELIDKLLDFYSPFALNILSDVDLDHPLKFTRFSMRFQKFDGTISDTSYFGIVLTDNEYVDLLSDLLKSGNHYSLNMMVYKRPELAQRIMSHIVSVFLDGFYDFAEPFLCDLYELKAVAKSILDPFEDKLQLFESEDEDIRNFITRHKVEPAGAGECIFSDYSEGDCLYCYLNFDGINMVLHQEGIKGLGEWYGTDDFIIDARIALKKFGLEKPDELYPYLKEHYNTRDCLSRIREFLTGS